jgi:hypothetical protein
MSVRRLVQRLLIVVVVALVILLTPLWLLRAADNGLVQNGLQSFTLCGKAQTSSADPFMNPLANRIMEATRGGARVGTWSLEKKADCDVYRHFVWD